MSRSWIGREEGVATLIEQDAEIGSTFYLEFLACSWRNYPVSVASTPDSLHTFHTSVLSAQKVPEHCSNFLSGISTNVQLFFVNNTTADIVRSFIMVKTDLHMKHFKCLDWMIARKVVGLIWPLNYRSHLDVYVSHLWLPILLCQIGDVTNYWISDELLMWLPSTGKCSRRKSLLFSIFWAGWDSLKCIFVLKMLSP